MFGHAGIGVLRSLVFRLLLRINLDQAMSPVAERLDLEDAPAEVNGACDSRAVEHERKLARVRWLQLSADEARVVDACERGDHIQLIPPRVKEFDGNRLKRSGCGVFQRFHQKLIEGDVPLPEDRSFLLKRRLIGWTDGWDCTPQ